MTIYVATSQITPKRCELINVTGQGFTPGGQAFAEFFHDNPMRDIVTGPQVTVPSNGIVWLTVTVPADYALGACVLAGVDIATNQLSANRVTLTIQQLAPQISLDKSSYHQGDTAYFSGSGFVPNGSIFLGFTTNNSGNWVGSAYTADSNGNISNYGCTVGQNVPSGPQKAGGYDNTCNVWSNLVQITVSAFTITVNASPAIDSPSGGGGYNYGDYANISCTDVAHYNFLYWTMDGNIYSYSESFSFYVDAAHTFTAVFLATPQYTITVNTSPTGFDAPTGGGSHYQGDTITIGVSNVAHYNFVQWNQDGNYYTGSQTFQFQVDGPHTFTAVFQIQSFAITVVTSPAGLDSPTGAGTYNWNTSASIGVSNVYGYTFTRWNRDGVSYTTNQSFSYTVDQARTFTAVFTPINYAITVNTHPTGFDTPTGAGTYPYTTNITISVVDVVNYLFTYWKRDGAIYSYSKSFSYQVDAAHTFTAYFARSMVAGYDAALKKLALPSQLGVQVAVKKLALTKAQGLDSAVGKVRISTSLGADASTRKTLSALEGLDAVAKARLAISHGIDTSTQIQALISAYGLDVTLRLLESAALGIDVDLLKYLLYTNLGIDVSLETISKISSQLGIDASLYKPSLFFFSNQYFVYPYFLTGHPPPMALAMGYTMALRENDLNTGQGIDSALALAKQTLNHGIGMVSRGTINTPHSVDLALLKYGLENDFGLQVYLVAPFLYRSTDSGFDAVLLGSITQDFGVDVKLVPSGARAIRICVEPETRSVCIAAG